MASPRVPAKCEVLAARERLWEQTYVNPDSAWWQVQAAKERLWAVRNACPTCYEDLAEAQGDWNALMWARQNRLAKADRAQAEIWGPREGDGLSYD